MHIKLKTEFNVWNKQHYNYQKSRIKHYVSCHSTVQKHIVRVWKILCHINLLVKIGKLDNKPEI